MLLNKKRGLLVLSSLFLALLVPIVSAQYEGVYSMFSFLFGTGEGAFMFLKAGVWIILFAIIFWGSTKIFSGSKGIATIFSIVFSLISIRFIPDEFIYYIGSAYGVFGIVLLILVIIGGTLLILNSYFPIKEHKAFGVVWALFYFFVAWVFEQLKNIDVSNVPIDGIGELIELISPWGKYVSIVLGLACLYKAFSGRGKYARRIKTKERKKKRFDKKKDLDDIKRGKNKAKEKEEKIINDEKKIEHEDKSQKEKLIKEITEETKKQILILKNERKENETYIARIKEETEGWLDKINHFKNILKKYHVELKKINYEVYSMHNEGLDGVPGRTRSEWGTINIKKREKIQKEINEIEVEMEYEKSLRVKTMKLKREYINRNKQLTDELREISYSYKRQVSKIRESE